MQPALKRGAGRNSSAAPTSGGPDTMEGLPDEVVHRILLLVGLDDLGPVAAVASRYRLGVSSVLKAEGPTLLREGMELFRGENFRVENKVRGQALARAAAGGLPLAVRSAGTGSGAGTAVTATTSQLPSGASSKSRPREVPARGINS